MAEFSRINQVDDEIATIRDTGITVHAVVSASLGGWNTDEIIAKFPAITTDDIQQALSYTIQRQSMARINSLQELRPEIATIAGYGDLFLVGLDSDELTSKQIAQIISNNANMLNYKCMYQIVRARLLNPWIATTDWGMTTLTRLQAQLGIYLTPNIETVDFKLTAVDQTISIDSRLVPITGFLTQGYRNALITVTQEASSVILAVTIPRLPEGYNPLSGVEYLAKVVLQLLDSSLKIETTPDNLKYTYSVAIH